MTDTDHTFNTSVTLVSPQMKHRISDAILAKLATIPQVRYLSFDEVRLLEADFKDNDLPAIQLFDVGDEGDHEGQRFLNRWQIVVEILMRSSRKGVVRQVDLWDFEFKVKRALFSQPNLGIPGVAGIRYVAGSTDLHTMQPFYFSRLQIEVKFYENLVGDCT